MSTSHVLLVLAIYVLAAARVTRLINADTILEPVRLWIAGRAELASVATGEADTAGQPTRATQYRKRTKRWVGVYDWVICPWCAGFWIALAGAAIAVPFVLAWPWWAVPPVGFACSHLIGVFARFAND